MTESRLLARLMRAETEDERSWIVTESLIETLSPELATVVWAVAIPHWFNADILAALRPELQDQAEFLYSRLKTLSFVEPFLERGYNIHERTRKFMLEHLWQNNPEEFRQLSANAVSYFAQIDSSPTFQIEWLYHSVVANAGWRNDSLEAIVQDWTNNFWRAEIESLLDKLMEQVAGQRTQPLVTAEIHYWSGKAKSHFHQYSEALLHYEQSLTLFRSIGNNLGEAKTSKAIGDMMKLLNQNEEEILYSNYLHTANALKDLAMLYELASWYQTMGRYQRALPLLERALEINKRVLGDNHLDTASSFNNLARVYELREQTEALNINRENNDYRGISISLNNLASAYYQMGEYERALMLCAEALDINERNNDYRGIAISLSNLASVYYEIGESGQALRIQKEALDINRENNDYRGIAISLSNLGSMYYRMGEYGMALTLYREALDVNERNNDYRGIAISLSNLASVYYRIEKYEQVLPLYERALLLLKREIGMSHPDMGYLFNDIAAFFYRMERYADAAEAYGTSLAILIDTLGSTHPSTGFVWQNLIDLVQNMIALGRERELKENPLTRAILENLRKQ